MNHILKNKTLHSITFLTLITLLLAGCGEKIEDPYVYLNDSINLALTDGNWPEAKKTALSALDLDPDNIDAKIMYAFTLDQNGEQAEAIKKLREVISQNQDSFLAHLTLGRILFEMEDYEGAYDTLANAYNINPDSQNVLVLYTECSAKLLAQNTDELLNKLAKTETYKGKPIIYNEIAVYYAKTGNVKQALENLVKAYKLSSKNPTIVLNMAILCDKYLSQSQKSKFFYNRFITLTNNNPAYNLQRGQVNKRLKVI